MDFAMSAKAADYHKRLTEFMVEQVFPAEKSYDEYRAAAPGDYYVGDLPLGRDRTLGTPTRAADTDNIGVEAFRRLTNSACDIQVFDHLHVSVYAEPGRFGGN